MTGKSFMASILKIAQAVLIRCFGEFTFVFDCCIMKVPQRPCEVSHSPCEVLSC